MAPEASAGVPAAARPGARALWAGGWLIGLCACLALPQTVRAEEFLISPGERVAGVSQNEWSLRWWQWAFSFERVRSPIADRTGALCASRQQGDVWFLAGTYGSARVERRCTVPAGKTLFFPLINYVSFRSVSSNESCAVLVADVRSLTQRPEALVLELDGHRYEHLDVHRFATGCFSLVPGQPPDAAADGYFVALRPLPKGRHVIHLGGILPTLMQAVSYTITVE